MEIMYNTWPLIQIHNLKNNILSNVGISGWIFTNKELKDEELSTQYWIKAWSSMFFLHMYSYLMWLKYLFNIKQIT